MNDDGVMRPSLATLLVKLAKAHFSKGDANDFKRQLFTSFKQMGGVYVKFLQVLATNTDFLSGWATPSESSVFEDVELEPIDIYRVFASIEPNYHQHFAAANPVPIASGSFAQVYQAQLKNGQPVIIKVLRPSVSRNFKKDIKSLGYIVKMINLISPRGMIDYQQSFNEFRRITELETDYLREYHNAHYFYKYFSGHQSIVVPKTYRQWTTPRVLVQDYVGGLSLAEAMIAQQKGHDIAEYVYRLSGSNIWQILETLGIELLISTVSAEHIFGDPHPGNIKILPNNQIGFIDFGVAANAPTSRHCFVEFIREYHNLYQGQFRPDKFAVAGLAFYDNVLSQAISVAASEIDGRTVNDLIGQAAKRVFEIHKADEQSLNYLDNLQMTKLMTQVLNKGNRFNVKLDTNNLAMLRASHMYMATVRLIVERAGQPQSVSTEIIRRAFKAMIDHADNNGVVKSPSSQLETLSNEKSLQLFGDWIAGIADRDPQLYRQITEYQLR